jgi:TPR repeat protein
MKWVALLLPALVIQVAAQNSRIGAFSYGSGSGSSSSGSPTPGLMQRFAAVEYRKIDGKIYYTAELSTISGTISEKDGNVLILYQNTASFYGPRIALKNFSGINGDAITVSAKKIGDYTWNQTPLELWDYGTLPNKEEIAAKKNLDDEKSNAIRHELERQQLAELQVAEQRAAAKKASANAAALKSNQNAAAKGDTYGLLRMGERYRDGDGVEKDLSKARDYLQRATDAGSDTAKEELSKLPAK